MKPVDNIECKIKFDVPDGYFDTLADNVMQRIDFDDKQRKKRRSTVVRSIFAMAAAAAIAGVVVFGPQNRPADHYLTNISRQYSDINVIDYIDQSNNTDDAKTEYDADLVAMYASPINFMY